MIVIRLGSDEYKFKGGVLEKDELFRKLRANTQSQWVSLPKSITNDMDLVVAVANITSFYWQEDVEVEDVEVDEEVESNHKIGQRKRREREQAKKREIEEAFAN